MKTPLPHRSSEKGQSLVELAVSLVILMVILAGVVEIGKLLFQYIAMRDAAQEGAVYASIYPTSCNQAIERVRKSLYNADPNQINVTVLINGVACVDASATDACANKTVKVTVNQPNYQITMPFIGAILGSQTINVSASTTSTILRPLCQ